MSSKLKSKKSNETYYYLPLTDTEVVWIKNSSMQELRDRALMLLGSVRPKLSNSFLFIVKEKIGPEEEIFFLFVMELKPKGKVNPFIFGNNKQYSQRFQSITILNPNVIMTDRKKIQNILGIGIKPILEAVRVRFMELRKEQSQKAQKQLDSLLSKEEIDVYVNDFSKQILKQHSHLEPIIKQKRNQLIKKYISDPSLSLKKMSKKNSNIFKNLRKQHQEQLLQKYGKSVEKIPQQLHRDYHKKIDEYRNKLQHERQQEQRRLMEKQDKLQEARQQEQRRLMEKQDKLQEARQQKQRRLMEKQDTQIGDLLSSPALSGLRRPGLRIQNHCV